MVIGHCAETEYEQDIGHSTETEYKGVPSEAFVMEVEHETGSGDCESSGDDRTPKQKAMTGILRRRDAKKLVRKKLMAMGRKLHQVLLASAFVLGSMANEYVVKSGVDLLQAGVKSLGGQSFGQQHHWRFLPGVLKLSGMFAASGHGVLRPRDLIFGDDLRQEETQTTDL